MFFIPLWRAPGEGARNVCSSLGETNAPATQETGKQALDREMPFMDSVGAVADVELEKRCFWRRHSTTIGLQRSGSINRYAE